MEKIKKNDALRSITMFLLDNETEARYRERITEEIEAYKNSMLGISSIEGLKSFIRSDENAIEKLTTVLGVSGERFNRVISLLRFNKGYVFTTEWADSALRKNLINDPSFMDEFCNLLLNGREIPKYKESIPAFVLDYFHIDSEVIARICNDDVLERQIKSTCMTKYNKDITYAYAARVDNKIKDISQQYGLRYELMPLPGDSLESFYMIHDTERFIIVNYQYSVTTGKGQSDFATKMNAIHGLIRDRENYKNLTMLDGAGWLVRGADWDKIYGCCDFFLTLNTLDQLNAIIKDYYKI